MQNVKDEGRKRGFGIFAFNLAIVALSDLFKGITGATLVRVLGVFLAFDPLETLSDSSC